MVAIVGAVLVNGVVKPCCVVFWSCSVVPSPLWNLDALATRHT